MTASTMAGRFGAVVAATVVMTVLAAGSAIAKPGRGLDPWAANLMRSTHGSGAYGEFDPWAYKALHAAPLEVRTEHSSGQAVSRRPIVPVLQTVPIAGDANGFDWEDAGIGAVTAVGAISFVLGAAVVRRQRKIATAG